MNAFTKAVLMGALCLGGCAGRSNLEGAKDFTAYQAGQNPSSLLTIEAEIRGAKPEQYSKIEAKLLAVIKAKDATANARKQAVRCLGVVGSKKSIGTLAGLLKDEQLSHAARIALEGMDEPAAGAALRRSLGKLKGGQLAGVIGSVGTRRDAAAIPALQKLAKDSDAAVASAAIAALGSIGNAKAAAALQDLAATSPAAQRPAVVEALGNCADRMCADGQCAAAGTIFRSLLGEKAPASVRINAARGLIGTTVKEECAALMVELVQSDDAATRLGALFKIRCVMADPAVQSMVLAKLDTLKPVARLAILNVLPDMPKAAAREPVLKMVKAATGDIRRAAIAALAFHGDVADVPMLVTIASSASDADKETATKTLELIGKRGVDTALMGLLATDAGSRRTVIAILAARRSTAALPALTELLTGTDVGIAVDAAGAIGSIGGIEQLAILVKLINQSSDEKLRGALEKAAGEVCTRIADSKLTGPFVLPALEKAGSPPARIALIRLLPRVRGDAALAAARKAADDSDAMIREAAIRALADWPEIAAAKPLFEVAKQADNDRMAIIAMQGCIRLAGRKDASNGERVNVLKTVIDDAKRPEEKRQAVSGLGEIATADALTLATKYVDDTVLAVDAGRAVIRMANQKNAPPKEPLLASLDKFKASAAVSPELKRRLEECSKQVKEKK